MFHCPRHGDTEVLFSDSFAAEPAVHTLGCGCRGTTGQLNDPDYLKEVPDPQVLDLEQRLAEALARVEQLEAAKPAEVADTLPEPAVAEAPATEQAVQATKAAQAHADSAGIDLSGIQGTGKGGAITKADVLAALAAQEPVPTEEDAKSGEGLDDTEGSPTSGDAGQAQEEVTE